jgi:hypothetical protein
MGPALTRPRMPGLVTGTTGPFGMTMLIASGY